MQQHPQGISNLGHHATPLEAEAPVRRSPPLSTSFKRPIVAQTSMPTDQWHVHNIQPIKNTRKRSRDEMGWDDDSSSRSSTAPFPSVRHTPSPKKGDMMTDDGTVFMQQYAQESGSGYGVWAEELAERLRTSGLTRDIAQACPGLEARKSIRLDRSRSVTDFGGSTTVPKDGQRISVQDPAIDAASLALGVGWSSIPADSTMAQASRGWARHIERHFPLQSVKILWKSSLPAYLVEAVTDEGRERADSASQVGSRSPWNSRPGSNGYYLFDEDLKQGKMIAKSWEKALINLRATPMMFDGERVMEADKDEAQRHTESNNVQHWAGWRPSPTIGSPDTVQVPAAVACDGMDVD